MFRRHLKSAPVVLAVDKLQTHRHSVIARDQHYLLKECEPLCAGQLSHGFIGVALANNSRHRVLLCP